MLLVRIYFCLNDFRLLRLKNILGAIKLIISYSPIISRILRVAIVQVLAEQREAADEPRGEETGVEDGEEVAEEGQQRRR